MLFGEKFYPLINKMPAWRHSLFALVLATRQYPNFALWCEVKEVQGKTQYINALKACWHFHYDKFNHVDLSAAFDEIAPFLPMELEEYSEGDSFAFDAAVMLDAALSSVPDNTKGALNASQASLASVIRYCEHAFPDQCATEEDLLDLTPIQAEMSFQIELMEQVRLPRSPQNVIELCRMALASGCSNIGLESELSFEDFAECFVSAAPSTAQQPQDAKTMALVDESLENTALEEDGLTALDTNAHDQPNASLEPWNEQDLIVFSPECPDGFTPPKDLHDQLAAAQARANVSTDAAHSAEDDLADDTAPESAANDATREGAAHDVPDYGLDADAADAWDEADNGNKSDAVDAMAAQVAARPVPQSVPSYAEMMALEAAQNNPALLNADQDLELTAPESAADAAAFEVAPEDLARTDYNLRKALAEQESAAALLEQLTANNERLGAEEALIMAQAQAMAEDEARARGERAPAPPQVPVEGPQAPAANPDDAEGEVDVDLEFERIAQAAALLEQQLEQELLLETGQDLDSIIASGADLATLRRPSASAHSEQSEHTGNKHHKEGKHHQGHSDHHKDKGSKDGKAPKFADKKHGTKDKFKGDKSLKDGKPFKDGKGDKSFKAGKGDKHWKADKSEGKSGKWGKDDKPWKADKSEGKWSKGDKHFKDGKGDKSFKGEKSFKSGKGDKPWKADKSEGKSGKSGKGDKPGKKHGAKSHDDAPKVFGAHAPGGKQL